MNTTERIARIGEDVALCDLPWRTTSRPTIPAPARERPTIPSSRPAIGPKPAAPGNAQGEKIGSVALVVDDDVLFRTVLDAILTSRLGCSRVIEAAGFDEALERLSEHADISIALFDLSMPGIRNLANLKIVAETFPNVRTAVVSAPTSRRDALMSQEAGVHGYVPKSLDVVELTAALKAIVEGTVYVPSFLADMSPGAAESQLPSDQAAYVAAVRTLDALTPRQQDVLQLIVGSTSTDEMARIFNLSEGTVNVHVSALFRNLGVNSRLGAAMAGARLLSGARGNVPPASRSNGVWVG